MGEGLSSRHPSRRGRRWAFHCATPARQTDVPPRVAALRHSWRDTALAARAMHRTMARTPQPCAPSNAISSRSQKQRQRPVGFLQADRSHPFSMTEPAKDHRSRHTDPGAGALSAGTGGDQPPELTLDPTRGPRTPGRAHRRPQHPISTPPPTPHPHKRHQHPHSTPQTPRQLASLIKLSRQPAESTALPSSRTSFSSTLDPPRLTARRYRTGRPGSIPDSPRPGAQSPVMAPGSPAIRRMAAPTASTSPARPPPTPRRSPRPQPGTTRYSSPRRCFPPPPTPDMRGHTQSALSQGKEHHHPYSSPQR